MKAGPYVLWLLLLLQPVSAAAQTITTIAGTPGVRGNSGNGIPAVNALLNYPYVIAVDGAGNVYIGDHTVIRKVNTDGIIHTIAGTGIRGYSGDGGLATAAQIEVGYLDVDKAGNIYLTDANHFVVRKINPSGIISTIAGNGTFGYSGDGGPATAAQLHPADIEVDDAGNIYVADYHHGRIRKINVAGIITTIAGNGIPYTTAENGLATTVPVIPAGLAVDKSGNLYVTDNNSLVRKINTAGVISTFAGTVIHGYRGDGGPATEAWLNTPLGIDIDDAGNIYIADADNHRIRRIDAAGIISTIAGTGVAGYSGDGGPAVGAQITLPTSVVVDGAEAIYFPDVENATVRKISACPFIVKPDLTIAASALTVCSGVSITFTATVINGSRHPGYQWKVNGNHAGPNSAVFVTNTLADRDVISCMLTDSIDCVIPAFSNSLVININPSPAVTLAPEITILPRQSVTLDPVVTGVINRYQWMPADKLNNPAILNPVASPMCTTTYQLKVISNDGCEASGKTTITVYRKI